jgi:hypothetical protein
MGSVYFSSNVTHYWCLKYSTQNYNFTCFMRGNWSVAVKKEQWEGIWGKLLKVMCRPNSKEITEAKQTACWRVSYLPFSISYIYWPSRAEESPTDRFCFFLFTATVLQSSVGHLPSVRTIVSMGVPSCPSKGFSPSFRQMMRFLHG